MPRALALSALLLLGIGCSSGPAPRSAYLHEMVHLVLWRWHELWIREGLAAFLNDELGGYRTNVVRKNGKVLSTHPESKIAQLEMIAGSTSCAYIVRGMRQTREIWMDGTLVADIYEGLAHLAICWYKLGRRESADRAMRYLARRQNRSGGFFRSWGPGAAWKPSR